MALQNGEAWLTSATSDDNVIPALILLESLKRVKTTKRIGVITCENVSKENRMALRKAFDAFFMMDDSFSVEKISNEDRARIYAFSLCIFEKCMFISSKSLVLENADGLFEGTQFCKVLENGNDGSMDLSLFLLSPNMDLCLYIAENSRSNGKTFSGEYLKTWMAKQNKEMGYIEEKSVMKFSVDFGSLFKQQIGANLVLFESANGPFVDVITSLKTKDMGLLEKNIIEKWLGMFYELVSGPLGNPQNEIITHASKGQKIHNEPIAIIGMSCRYPGANSVMEFWNLLYKGEEGIREPPAFRWTKEHSLRVSQQERKSQAGFLACPVDEFDARFFGISPKEAAYMDPQARLLHEVMWESLEDSGIDPLSLNGTHTGIFTGSWMNDYKDIVQGSSERDFFRTYMGNSIGASAARLSFLLGLTGPSIATESGCSSAIVALDLAVKSLRNRETNLALAGGVNLLLHPFTSTIMEYVISPNGRCKTFDKAADGFGRAEGCGALVLKRLSEALRDRDNIWAVIRGSAVSQEGISKSLGTPTVHCEALAMQMALADASVSPDQVSFIETHGTGTAVGDPMEIAAIAKAYGNVERITPLIIGSVKTNMGHTESCSGITGIMKTVLAMQHELIPKHLNLETLNPEIHLESIPATIPLEPIVWPKVKGHPRIAGVSSFGITGTDGHVIIEEAPDYQLPKFTLGLERPLHIMKISGKTNEALEELLLKYQDMIEHKTESSKENQENFADVAYTANIGRAPFNHRSFIVAGSFPEAFKVLQEGNLERGEISDSAEARKICFLFTGQGSQYSGMARSLYETCPVFRIHFDECDRILRKLYGLSIFNVLWQTEGGTNKELCRTLYSQTSIFCVEYCLLKLWESWGILPDYVLGHSLGEFAAAVAADILEFQDALMLVAERSRLIDNISSGSMLVIKANKEEVAECLRSTNLELDFAAVNSPEQTVVAGDTNQIEKFRELLKSKGLKTIILEATHAFHSRHMDPMLEEYRKVAESVLYKSGNPRCKYVSGMEGIILESSSSYQIDADYWVRHTRNQVSFTDACKTLQEVGCQDFLEVGPQPILSSFVMINSDAQPLNCFPSLRRGANDWHTILTSLGKLYLLGYKVDWKGLDDPYERKKVSLPLHPFQRKSFWVEPSILNTTHIHPLIGYSINNASHITIFQNELNIKSVPYLRDHCIGSRIVFPGAGYTEMCLTAAYSVAHSMTDGLEKPKRAIQLENVRIEAPLELKEEKKCRLQVVVDLLETTGEQSEKKSFRTRVYHQNNSEEGSGKWLLHASSDFYPAPSVTDCLQKCQPQRIAQLLDTVEPTPIEKFYAIADKAGLKFGKSFKSISRFWSAGKGVGRDEVVAELTVPSDFHKYLLHPLIIDSMFQAGILTTLGSGDDSVLQVPVSISKLTLLSTLETTEFTDLRGTGADVSKPRSVMYIHAWWEGEIPYSCLVSKDYTPIAVIENLEMVESSVRTIESVLEQQTSSIPDAWEEIWKQTPGPNTSLIELPDIIDMLAGDEFKTRIDRIHPTAADEIETAQKSDRLIYLYSLKALYILGWQPNLNDVMSVADICEDCHILPSFSQLVHFYFTIFRDEHTMEYDSNTKLWKVINLPPSQEKVENELVALVDWLKATKIVTAVNIYEYLSGKLPEILRGTVSPLAILFPVDEDKRKFSSDVYYQNHPSRAECVDKFTEVLSTIFCAGRDINPEDRRYRILEVGAGTGSLTGPCLETLHKAWGNNYEYYFTDISKAFFTNKFEDQKHNMKYAVFNIEDSPLEQGIPLDYFDMVLCTDVIHATKNLQESLTHLHQTLRPGGILCFTETLIASWPITFIYGLLSGYWRMEDLDWRPHHCCVGEQVWREMLTLSGFESVGCVKGYGDTAGCFTAKAAANDNRIEQQIFCPQMDNMKEWLFFITANNRALVKAAKVIASCGSKVTLVLNKEDSDLLMLSDSAKNIAVTTATPDADDSSAISNLFKTKNLYGAVYGWGMDTTEMDQKKILFPFLVIAQTLLTMKKPPKLYIFTQGVHSVSESLVSSPSPATLFGSLKSLKNENSELFVRYVDLEYSSGVQSMTEKVLYELSKIRETHCVQVVYRDDIRYEPRFAKTSVSGAYGQLELPPCTERYALVLPESRLLQDLQFEPKEEGVVVESEVEVKIKAYALNFRDIFAVLKPSKQFENLSQVGIDFAGVVTKAGTSSKYKVGERVFGANFGEGQLPSHLVIDSHALLRIPPSMSCWEAATLPAVFLTAYHCLINVAQLKQGDTVLIHTGSGGVGLAAIQLAKRAGAEIITTAGNRRKRAYLRSLGIEHVFHSRDTSYEQEVLRVTNGRGVDVVLNSITGPGVKEATLRATARNGRWVEMSKLSVWTNEEVKSFRPDVDYSIVDLTTLDRSVCSGLLEQINNLLIEGVIKAIPFVKFDALCLRQAMQYLQKAKHIGKVVVTMPEVSLEHGQFKTKPQLFNAESTYLITGGLGGIGFEVCKWMLEKGATDVVLVGRSAPKPEIARNIEKLNESGHNVVIKLGDVGNVDHCKNIIDHIKLNMKPLRGIQHSAGVLRDNMYGKQTWESFEATFRPKVKGTWNLHNLTRDMQLEHFVCYSSSTALFGTPSQPNHAAANCFEDAFVHYRHSLGLSGNHTVNWGQWSQVGCAKDIHLPGIFPCSVSRMLNGLEFALRTQKLQICFGDFESFQAWGMLCPMMKSYLPDGLLTMETDKSGQGLKAEKFWQEMDNIEDKQGKCEILSGYLKTIIRTGLRLEANEPINIDANIQDLGVDSLMLIELRNSIQTLLGSRVTVSPALLKSCNTIRELSVAIVGKILSEESEAEVILSPEELTELLHADCQLDENIQTLENLKAVNPTGIKTVLVTGCTGQLGPYLITELCKTYGFVERIICLIRTKTGTTPEARLEKILKEMQLFHAIDFSKIECIRGDVAKPNFGLKPDEYLKLCQSVDGIIHSAVKGDHIESYKKCEKENSSTDLRTVNVGGTINVLKFAATEKLKHVYYASAYTSIFGGLGEEKLCDKWPELTEIEKIVKFKIPGYQTSKYVGEVLIKQANERGIPCKVFRFPWITGDSQTGRLNYMNNHYILRLLSYLKLKAIPSEVFPFVVLPVDICAELSLKLFFMDEAPFEIFNIGPPHPQLEQDFVYLAKEEFDMDLELVELKEFAEKLKMGSPLESLKQLYMDVGRLMSVYTSEAFQTIQGFLLYPDTFFGNKKLSTYIPGYDKRIESSMDIVRKDLRYVKSTGFFDKFNI